MDHILSIAASHTTDLNGIQHSVIHATIIYLVYHTTYWQTGEVLAVDGRETDFTVPTVIRKKMTGAASSGFDCNYSLLDVEKTHEKDTSLRLCGM